jgi:MFS family permease
MSITTPDPRPWWALSLLCAAQFIVILDTSIIGIALPAIQTSLGFTAECLSWIFNAYVIVFGGLLLLGGRLSDLFGARRVFILGFAVLTAGLLVAGFATSQEALLSGRALQGLGAARIAPSAMTMLVGLFSHNGAELGRAFAFWGASAAAGGAAGVFLGGVITQWMSWEWTFLINAGLRSSAIGCSSASTISCRSGQVSRQLRPSVMESNRRPAARRTAGSSASRCADESEEWQKRASSSGGMSLRNWPERAPAPTSSASMPMRCSSALRTWSCRWSMDAKRLPWCRNTVSAYVSKISASFAAGSPSPFAISATRPR